MSEHRVFYYPYAMLGAEQSPLFRAAALYFDKLFILDPLKASWATIGPGEREPDLRLLESEGILERIAPEEILLRNDKSIGDAIERDLTDLELRKLCAEKEQRRWTLALAKVPQRSEVSTSRSGHEDSDERRREGLRHAICGDQESPLTKRKKYGRRESPSTPRTDWRKRP